MLNEKVRFEMMKRNVKQWELAKMLNVSESTITRMFREELPEEKQKELLDLIKGSDHND